MCGNEANRDQKAPQVASQLNLYALAVVTLRSQGGSPLEATFLHGRNLLVPPVTGVLQVGVETSICSFVAVLEGSSSVAQQEKAFCSAAIIVPACTFGCWRSCVSVHTAERRERETFGSCAKSIARKVVQVVGEPPGCAWSVAYRRHLACHCKQCGNCRLSSGPMPGASVPSNGNINVMKCCLLRCFLSPTPFSQRTVWCG